MPDTAIDFSKLCPIKADGFVVVSIWTPARYISTKWTYDFYTSLKSAVGYFRALQAGKVADYTAHGIFATCNGLPIGGALDMAAIDAVMVGEHDWRHPPGAADSSPENKQLAERAIYNGDAPEGREVEVAR